MQRAVTAELSRKVAGASELCSAASNLPILRFSPRTPQRLRLGSFAPALAACSRGISERKVPVSGARVVHSGGANNLARVAHLIRLGSGSTRMQTQPTLTHPFICYSRPCTHRGTHSLWSGGIPGLTVCVSQRLEQHVAS